MREKLVNAADRMVAVIAARQHGAISTAQLYAAGLTANGIARRVAAGRLHRVHRGVYAVGHAGLSREGAWMAAVVACGEGALLSHLSAAMLWGMLKSRQAAVHVSVPTPGGRARRKALHVHRCATLSPSHARLRSNIPVTSPARTLWDLRRVAPGDEFRRALRQAEFLRLPIHELEADRTRSELERRFLALCRRARLPAPEVNVRVGAFLVDLLWR